MPTKIERINYRRERKAFEAGWVAGADRMEDCFYDGHHRNFTEAWKHYRDRAKKVVRKPNKPQA